MRWLDLQMPGSRRFFLLKRILLFSVILCFLAVFNISFADDVTDPPPDWEHPWDDVCETDCDQNPEGPPESAPPRTRFPSPPPPPPGVYRMRRRVEWRDLDETQHVNNAAYLAYLEDCGLQVCAAHGWPLARMQEEGFAIFQWPIHSVRSSEI